LSRDGAEEAMLRRRCGVVRHSAIVPARLVISSVGRLVGSRSHDSESCPIAPRPSDSVCPRRDPGRPIAGRPACERFVPQTSTHVVLPRVPEPGESRSRQARDEARSPCHVRAPAMQIKQAVSLSTETPTKRPPASSTPSQART
jgi:hypothetical protein